MNLLPQGLRDLIWEYSCKLIPEWEGPDTPEEGVVDEEVTEDVDYREKANE